MPPEQHPFLAILDLIFGPEGLEGRVEYHEPAEGRNAVRMRWGVGTPPAGFERAAKGLVFVADHKTPPPAKDDNPSISISEDDYFTYAEGFAGAERMMLLVLLPAGYELAVPDPAPSGARLLGDRIGVFWRLTPAIGDPAEVRGTLRKFKDVAVAIRSYGGRRAGSFHPQDKDPHYQVFISYRRKDDRWAAGRLGRFLAERLGEEAVFRDVVSIRAGNFRIKIDKAIAQSRIVLALIGPYWLDPDREVRRIDSEDDWPRVEIEAALQLKRLVIPVLLDDTTPPTMEQLPESLAELTHYHCVKLREDRFEADAADLLKTLREELSRPSEDEMVGVA